MIGYITIYTTHSKPADGVNRDGGRFVDHHKVLVYMQNLHPSVQHLHHQETFVLASKKD